MHTGQRWEWSVLPHMPVVYTNSRYEKRKNESRWINEQIFRSSKKVCITFFFSSQIALLKGLDLIWTWKSELVCREMIPNNKRMFGHSNPWGCCCKCKTKLIRCWESTRVSLTDLLSSLGHLVSIPAWTVWVRLLHLRVELPAAAEVVDGLKGQSGLVSWEIQRQVHYRTEQRESAFVTDPTSDPCQIQSKTSSSDCFIVSPGRSLTFGTCQEWMKSRTASFHRTWQFDWHGRRPTTDLFLQSTCKRMILSCLRTTTYMLHTKL